jgi:hypothetical protein
MIKQVGKPLKKCLSSNFKENLSLGPILWYANMRIMIKETVNLKENHLEKLKMSNSARTFHSFKHY